jgi:hypothetical protein
VGYQAPWQPAWRLGFSNSNSSKEHRGGLHGVDGEAGDAGRVVLRLVLHEVGDAYVPARVSWSYGRLVLVVLVVLVVNMCCWCCAFPCGMTAGDAHVHCTRTCLSNGYAARLMACTAD